MNFSAYSIKNPLVAILLFSLLTLGGIIAFNKTKVQQFPDIDLPAVVVTMTMAGASPAQLENDVAKKIENKLASIDGVKHIRTTVQTGAVTVATEFRLEKDINEALDDVRSAVSEVRGDLPASADEPIISKVSTAGFPVVSYSVASDSMNAAQLSWWVDDTLSKALLDIDGVGTITRIGGIERQIIVAADAERLGGWQLSIASLSNQIANLWSNVSGGEAKIAGATQTIRVVGKEDSMSLLNALQITTPMGATRLDSLAMVDDGAADIHSSAFLNGDSVVAFHITRSRGASEVAMVQAVDSALSTLQNNSDVVVSKIYDNAQPIDEDYKASLQMLIEGCLLAVLVVFVFLRDWRATLVAAAALPLSIIPTFLAMYWLDFSLNMISLLALSLVIGVLVDDAIVEVENITRHLHMGKTPFDAAMEAADEIGLAVIATTFTLIAVFLPTAFMNGVVGQFFRQFGWTASIAVFASLLVARLVTPMMAAYLLKPTSHTKTSTGRLLQGYLRVVSWTLNHRLITLSATIAFFVGSLLLAGWLPSAFIPNDDSNQSQVTLELTPDVSIDDTIHVAKKAHDVITQIEGVQAVFVAVGEASANRGDIAAGAGAVNKATINVVLEERGLRPTKTQIESAIRQSLQDIAGARFSVGLSVGGDTGYSFSLTGNDMDVLVDTVNRAMQELSTINGLTASSNLPLPKPELTVIPDRLAMAQRGTTTTELANTLRVATQGDYEQLLPKMNFDTRQVPIVVRLPDEERQNMATLQQLYLSAGVQVGQVAQLNLGTGESEISRLDRERAVKITVAGDRPLGEVTQIVKNSDSIRNLPAAITLVEEGDAENMAELFEGFVLAMGVGVVCIFGVLMLLFHRVLQPFSILMALPLSIGGAFMGLLLTNSSLSMPSMIGFIMLMGIATKNSILLVDYAILAQNDGMDRLSAIIDACSKRARPIVMTTIAMGAGMLPLVLGWQGADITFRQPMAAAVLGGLITSTFLSLVVIPVVYTLMDDVGIFFKAKANPI